MSHAVLAEVSGQLDGVHSLLPLCDFKYPGLTASTFAYWAISLAHELFLFIFVLKNITSLPNKFVQ